MFGRIACRYDLANRLLSGGVDLWWRRRLVRAVRRAAPEDVLDLATGSGDVAFALARGLPRDTRITGMDFCEPMLVEARRKQGRKGSAFLNISFCQGDGLALPCPAASFDAVTISFGLRNMADRHLSLTEMRRVLRPGGRLFVLEFSQPSRWFRPLYYFYLLRLSPWLAGLITGERSAYEYLGRSIDQFPGAAALADEIRAAGFAGVSVKRMTFGIVALHEAAS
jgi:demethylmenaquinone methyltransferase/2-methoxy-6-polyprenyl-1,4-benzoquinol methylase